MATSDILLTLANSVAATLASLFETVTIDGAAYPITVEWTPNPWAELSDDDLKNPLIWAIDFAETLESEKGLAHEDLEVLIITQMRIAEADGATAAAEALSKLVSDITRTLRPRDSSMAFEVDGDAFVCAKTERRPARNFAEWREKRRFYAEIVATFRRY
jgi:hypothetical protein